MSLPLVILPGLNSGRYLFEAAPAALPKTKLLTFDPPGVGKPPMLPIGVPFTARHYATAVLKHLDSQGVDKFDLLGHSLGGYAAQEVAHLAPARVNRLILVSTSAGQPATARDVAAMPLKIGKSYWQMTQQIDKNPLEGLKPMFGKNYLTHNPHGYEHFIAQRAAHLPGPAVTLAQLAAGGAFSSQRWVRQLTMPTLVLHGNADVLITPASARELAGLLPNATYIELHGVGHFPMLEHDKFWPYVRDFLAGQTLGQKLDTPTSNGLWAKLKEIITRHG